MVPVAAATLALPPRGNWKIRVRRDSIILVPGSQWQRLRGFQGDFGDPVQVPSREITPWTEVATAQGKELRLSIPWAVPGSMGLDLATFLFVEVEFDGTGTAPLAPSVKRRVENPSGAAGFGVSGTIGGGRTSGSEASLLPEGNQVLVVEVTTPEPGDISHDGTVRLTGARIRSILGSFNGVDFSRVAVAAGFSGPIPLEMGPELPLAGPRPIPIRRIDRNRDGAFDDEDAIEFHAHGSTTWTDDSLLSPGVFSLSVHPWDRTRRYLVRLDAAEPSPEMGVGSIPVAPVPQASTRRPVWAGRHKLLHEQAFKLESMDLESGVSWMWHWVDSKPLGPADLRHPASTDLPGLADSIGRVVVRTVSTPPSDDAPITANGRASSFEASREFRSLWHVGGLRAKDNSWTWHHRAGETGFESYTIHYAFRPSPGSEIAFPAPGPGAFSMKIGGASSADSFLVTEDGIGRRVVGLHEGFLVDSARMRNTWYHPLGRLAQAKVSKWTPPTGKRVLAPSRFREALHVEMLVVSPDSFLDLATTYAEFRSDPRRIRPMETMVVRADDVWELLGGGSQDPLALRDLFRLARARWGTSHALLLGGGHFDPRGLSGAPPAPLPVWEDGNVSTDAVLSYLDPGEIARDRRKTSDIALGRIPARSRKEVTAWLDKIRRWEDPEIAVGGPWRNTFLATADDQERPTNGGSTESSEHTRHTEEILRAAAGTRAWLQSKKVYEVEYPMNAIREKPDAQRALLDQLNRGVAAMIYLGHGGYDVLSDERLLDTRSALLGLNNTAFPFLFFAGSCTVGRNDLGRQRGLSESLVTAEGKGAVAAVSGTRATFSEGNVLFGQAFWRYALRSTPTGGPRTLGEAFQDALNNSASDVLYSNNAMYNLLGDPGMIPFPAGNPLDLRTPLDTLAALDVRVLSGHTRGQVRLDLRTRPIPRFSTYTIGSTPHVIPYTLPGRSIVSLSAQGRDGKYEARLLTPARIPFGDTVELHVYAWDPRTLRDSAVMVSNVILAGVGGRAPNDHEGPSIRILPCDSSWSGGIPFGKAAEIPVPFCLSIVMEDSSGISVSDDPDDGVLLSVPGSIQPWHPAGIEQGGNFSRAVTQFSLDPRTFKPGRTYPLRVFARDLMGNASSASLELHTRAPGEIGLYEVFNRPNPVKGDLTTFHFKLLAESDSNGIVPQTLQASIRIHTLSGKLVRTLRTDLSTIGHPRPRAVWDLKDSFRNDVANGLYPYSVLLRVRDPGTRNWRQIERRGVVAVSR